MSRLGEENCRVALVQLADLHQYVFIYESLRQAAHACSIPTGVRASARAVSTVFRDKFQAVEAPVARAWLGLDLSVVPAADALFGDSQERPLRVATAEGLLKKKLTPVQLQSILDIHKHVTVWDEIAGCGKTMKMLLLAVMATSFTPDCLVVFAASTHRVASAFEAIAKEVFSPSQMLPLRVANTPGGAVDYGVQWLQKVVDAATSEENQLIACIDCVIDILVTAIRVHDWGYVTSPEGLTIGKLVVQLLADRHEYLDQHVYSCVETVQADVMANICLVTTTTATLAKLNSHQSPWFSWFAKERRFFLQVDELPDESMECITACGASCDLFVGGGDMNQFKDVALSFCFKSHKIFKNMNSK